MVEVVTKQEYEALVKRVNNIEMQISINQIAVPALFTIEQTSRLLGVGKSTVSTLIRNGKLVEQKDGIRKVRVTFESIKKYQMQLGLDQDFCEHKLNQVLTNKD